jgi:hypothetical protein
VPVNPVWPNDPIGNSSPRFFEYVVSMSHPNPRRSCMPGGVAGDVMSATIAGDRIRAAPRRPPASSIRQKRDKSAAVLNSPAWPATLSIRRAVGSWTTPRRNGRLASPHGHESWRQRSVGAIRPRIESGGRNIVSFIPSGVKTWRAAY